MKGRRSKKTPEQRKIDLIKAILRSNFTQEEVRRVVDEFYGVVVKEVAAVAKG